MSDTPEPVRGAQTPEARTSGGGGVLSWSEIRRGTPLRALIDLVQYGVAIVLLVLAAIVLVKRFIDFLTSLNNYTTALISAVDGVLVVIILIDIMRTVLTHLEGWGFPFRPFLVIGIIAAVRDILAVSTRLTLSAGPATGGSLTQSLFELGTNAGVILVLAVALFLTRGQNVDAETDPRQ
jgi:uncharacterized membrane protein (DUF373 family)